MNSIKFLCIPFLIFISLYSYAEREKNLAPPDVISRVALLDFQKLPKELQVIISRAAEDFSTAASGKIPKFAKIDSEFLDGGTVVYAGQGYKITVYKKVATWGKIDGYYYGPILHFTNSSLSSEADVSSVRFISRDELNKLQRK